MKKNKPLIISLIILCVIFTIGFYSVSIEPKGLHIQTSTIKETTLPDSWKNVNIMYITDLTIGDHYAVDQLNTLTKKIDEQKPDLIIFSGNLLSPTNKKTTTDQAIIDKLNTIQAPLGKFAILGPNDLTETQMSRAEQIYNKSDFTLLQNTTKLIYNKTLEPLNLMVLNKDVSTDQVNEILNTHPDIPTILITTKPQVFDAVASHKQIKIVLSSSTYGGNIGIPFVNKLFMPDNNQQYISGIYTNANMQTMLVSSGVGLPDNLPFRLLNRPKIYKIVLQQ